MTRSTVKGARHLALPKSLNHLPSISIVGNLQVSGEGDVQICVYYRSIFEDLYRVVCAAFSTTGEARSNWHQGSVKRSGENYWLRARTEHNYLLLKQTSITLIVAVSVLFEETPN
ncbi:unnamed protein product [Parnassius apollo]|uniref:(apollo) hypothetical protein n=1 Tax=Parnassius apollo TaxID=110799 RepID=A0A8S3WUL9_PARAO|nr:unnamed protein product [Parnassius apollo]